MTTSRWWSIYPSLSSSDLIVLSLYLIFGLIYHLINRRTYRHHRALSAHIVASIGELGLYYLGYEMSIAAFGLCMIQCGTNLALTKRLQKGIPSLTRPTYQAGAIYRPLVSIYALYTGRSQDYRDSILPLHSFIYARLLLLVFSTISSSSDFEGNINSRQVYNAAIIGSAIMAIGQGTRGVVGVVGYLMMVLVVGKIGLWTRAEFARPNKKSSFQPSLAKLFDQIGLRAPTNENLEMTNNGPPIGRLPADAFGHWLNALGRAGEEENTNSVDASVKQDVPLDTPLLVKEEEGISNFGIPVQGI
nr:uncharacterized protein CI109_002936 [Kwoniella shandongensis]KAA5528777.1 hypothetical protein CI109_002936 [Kwoniella shandongensis]